jgi:hypothetical protein
MFLFYGINHIDWTNRLVDFASQDKRFRFCVWSPGGAAAPVGTRPASPQAGGDATPVGV